jgi:hypothetical protein
MAISIMEISAIVSSIFIMIIKRRWMDKTIKSNQNEVGSSHLYLNIPDRVIMALVANKICIEFCAP